ncbi:MAG TPA: hypothetical protein VJ529_04710 [Candidatus Bathyarchaeia archaeon]|nr:hypothetical protein [Candidatus Bathyarchaeia archaeon]
MYFDIAMPLTLLAVTLVSLFLNEKTESKLKNTMQERQLGVWDAAMLVGVMAVMVYLIIFVREITLILMVLFLFAYSTLLFTFSYLFSKNRWYVGIVPPAVFILLFVFLRDTWVWSYFLSNVYALAFAVLITLYLVSLFSWKTTGIFGILLTGMDIVLVFVTGTMIQAAKVTIGLRLPVMVSVPLIPPWPDSGIAMMSLGLGDFFFAGLLVVQTLKRYGKRFSIVTAVGMTISFFIFEVLLLNFLRIPFAGTVMIITGWAPLVIIKELSKRKSGSSKI